MLKKIVNYLAVTLLIVTIALVATGKLYYYKAIIYNYVNIDDLDLFHNRKVEALQPQEWNISKNYNKEALSERLQKTLSENRSVAFLIVKDDSIRYEQYWENYSDSSLSNSFSMAKSIVSMLIGIAHQEGKIKSLDQPVADFIPEFKEGEKTKITIRHLLMMSSGLDWNEGYSSLTSQVTEAYYGSQLYKQVTSLGVAEAPGKYWEYKSCDTELLSIVLKNATGKSVADYASEKLWTPLHAKHAAQWSLDHRDGIEKAYCCFYSNARDFARFGKLYLNHGNWEGTSVIDSAYVQASVTPNKLLDKATGKPTEIYGYQWWITQASGQKVFYMRGILGQYVIVIPEKHLIIVRLGHKRSTDEKGIANDYPIFIEEVMKMYK
jgi:CubicO group peptidase (beta-lactamase class C family)